ncbi:MAG: thiamine pyrophosphate-binding protein, partial [Armatimonadetes bacterium]|nr:thiamine pyrophosphate-binding protein [Armatimonadota bacterium]
VHIDVDPANFGRNAPCRVGVTGDAAAALRVLLPRIGGAGAGQDPAPEVAVVRERAHRESERYPFFAPYIEAIREVVAPSGIFVGDMTQMVYTATATYPALAPRTFLFPAGFGTLGFALPVAIGAKVADPRRDVVAVLGDGGMLFNIQELVTACDEKVGLAVIVVNNGGYGEIKRAQKQRFGDRYVGADLHTPDFVALARGVGAEGVRVEEPRELGAAVRAALGRNRPTVIELPAPMILDVAR